MIAIALVFLSLAQQAPPRDPKPAPREAAPGSVLAGRVVDADTGTPIAGAIVNVTRAQTPGRLRAIEADDRGAFRITNLEAGDYRVTASPPAFKPTHVSAIYAPSLQLQARDVREDIVIRLDRALAIEGRVVDERGLPMSDVRVSAERVDRPGGTSEYSSDDRGAFRVFGLSPGTYRICGVPGPPPFPLIGIRASGDALDQQYVKACHAQPVAVKPGGTPHVVLEMRQVKAFTISGRVGSESGRQRLQVYVENLEPALRQGTQAFVREGRYTVSGVPPGEYVVRASALPDATDPGGRPDTERAMAVVRVESGDMDGIDLMTTKGATVVGRIVPESPLPAGTRLGVSRAGTYRRVPPTGFQPSSPRTDLTFELREVFEPLMFDVTGLPRGWVVTSVRYRGADVTDSFTAFSTTRDPAELEISVSPRSAQLRVRVLDAEGRVVEGARIAMVRVSGDRVPIGAMTEAEPAKDGTAGMVPVRAGEYAVVAHRPEEAAPRGEAYVELIRRRGTRVVLTAGDARTIDVPLTRLADAR